MDRELRRTGIPVLGDVPWGTHFCQFYQTREDLLDVLVPYFKVGLEDNEACIQAQRARDVYCSTCMAVCPWSKQDRTVLHEVAHIAAAKIPRMANFMVKMDDLFGYGRITDGRSIRKWWDMDLPTRGVDSQQGRRRSALTKLIRRL